MRIWWNSGEHACVLSADTTTKWSVADNSTLQAGKVMYADMVEFG